ncbi:MAG TPA: DNA starvation/stationary phase protection protein, partial [Enterovirga sp.]
MANVRKLAPRTASRSLNTPTDLDEKGVAAVAAAVNGLVADSFALYVKTKNFHWHMSGPHFRDYHLLLDEQAQEIYAAIDPLAERVRKLGGTTLRSIGHIAKLQTI